MRGRWVEERERCRRVISLLWFSVIEALAPVIPVVAVPVYHYAYHGRSLVVPVIQSIKSQYPLGPAPVNVLGQTAHNPLQPQTIPPVYAIYQVPSLQHNLFIPDKALRVHASNYGQGHAAGYIPAGNPQTTHGQTEEAGVIPPPAYGNEVGTGGQDRHKWLLDPYASGILLIGEPT